MALGVPHAEYMDYQRSTILIAGQTLYSISSFLSWSHTFENWMVLWGRSQAPLKGSKAQNNTDQMNSNYSTFTPRGPLYPFVLLKHPQLLPGILGGPSLLGDFKTGVYTCNLS